MASNHKCPANARLDGQLFLFLATAGYSIYSRAWSFMSNYYGVLAMLALLAGSLFLYLRAHRLVNAVQTVSVSFLQAEDMSSACTTLRYDVDIGRPLEEDEELLVFYAQPLLEESPRNAADAVSQFTTAVNDAKAMQPAHLNGLPAGNSLEMLARVPTGPRPDSGRPKKSYKPVAKKVRPTSEKMPEEFRVVRGRPDDCLDSIPLMPVRPPEWEPTTTHLSRERMDDFHLDKDGFLWPEEIKLFKFLIEHHQEAFAWTELERRRFRSDYVPPIRYPVVPHEPWEDRNRPIPPGIRDELIKLLKAKIAAGVYEPSSSSYRSGWFCVVKKDGKSLRIVHDLQKLNSVTIRDAGTLPTPDEFSENCAGRTCMGALDQFSSFDLQLVDPESRDYTTFQTPIGPYRIVSLPMGWTNSVAVQHGNLTFILAPEIPEHVQAFIDDVHPLGPRSYYFLPSGEYETIEGNSGIRRFIWEYAEVFNRVVQRLRHAGASISGKKAHICVPETVVTGYRVSYEGRKPLQHNTQRVLDWPACENVSDVRAFLGTAGLSRMWIKDYAIIARPLTNLVKKDANFDFSDECHAAMIAMKAAVTAAPCLKPIDYTCGRDVILAVDSSVIGVGFILLQLGEKSERFPARYDSIAWTDRESRYSQPKLELYGLWRALRAVRIWIVGLPLLSVEVDAKFIKGMLNNPDVQPNVVINRWIAGILLFNIKLIHVSADLHRAADGLSRRRPAASDPVEQDDHKDWLDSALGLWSSAWLQLPTRSLPPVNSHGKLIQYPSVDPPSGYYKCPAEGPLARVLALVELKDNPIPVKDYIVVPPRMEHLRRKDLELQEIMDFLTTLEPPIYWPKAHLHTFVHRAKRFFIHDDRLWRRDADGRHKIVLMEGAKRMQIMSAAHDDLGHTGPWPTCAQIRDRFWWPGMEADVRWYCATCDLCQRRQTFKLHIPPTVAAIATLFQKCYMDTMHLPASNKFKYVVQGRCSLISYPEFRSLVRQTGETIGRFILEEILCRWGFLAEIVTDNGTPFIAALDWLANKYGIRHIRISGYNSQANGAVESKHYSVRESLVKLCDGDISRWSQYIHLIFWAERVTVRRTTGLSPYYMAHGVEPILPLDLKEATFLAGPMQPRMTTADLIALRARQLQRRPEDLERVREKVRDARWKNWEDFMRRHAHAIKDFNFSPGKLVLVRNTRIEHDLSLKKVEDRYCGPMVVVKRNMGGSYTLAELDGTVSILRCAAFRVVPYFPRWEAEYDIEDILEEAREQLKLIDSLKED